MTPTPRQLQAAELALLHLEHQVPIISAERRAARALAASLDRDPEPLMPPYDDMLLRLVREDLGLLLAMLPPAAAPVTMGAKP